MNQDTQTHCNSVARKGKHITFSERQQIERWLRENKSISQIAKLLDRHRVTIYREVKRGSVSQLKHDLTVYRTYRAQFAQDRSNEQKSAHGPALKIGSNHQLASQLAELMGGKLKHSPYAARQILIRNGIHCPFCSRTIYNYIYQGIIGISPRDMVQGPRKKRKKSVHKRLSHNHTGAISIENRPEEVNRRKDLGHFEMDCVVGPRGSHVAFLVLTERVTRFEIILRLKRKSSEQVVRALNRLERRLGAQTFSSIFRSITTDNGCEFADSAAISSSCFSNKSRTVHYVAHPYCASERGSNENANRFIRRFFPKGTDLSGVSQKTLNAIALWMNRYPRAIFNGKSAWHVAQPFRHYFTPLFS